MTLSEHDLLRRLGGGESITSICTAAGISRDEFDRWWGECVRQRVPLIEGARKAAVSSAVEIHRDSAGVPHIIADNDADLFYGFGFAMAQDRLFQLDYLRRKGAGRLEEILGAEGLDSDVVARTVGLNRIAADEWLQLPDETRALLTSFSDGINAFINQSGDRLPVEFDLLDYRPDPWSPLDCLTIESEFRWYLTGRLPVIAIPELAKRVLGEGALYREFLQGEADDECIMPAGSYAPSPANSAGDVGVCEAVGRAMGMPDDGAGSNNWVVAGRHTETGRPLIASDPHIALEAVSCWYEVHLCGGSFSTAGMAYVGMPAIIIGRNEHVAWAITNNICSLRDLYQEQTDEDHPGCFLFDGQWERSRELTETINVRDAPPVQKTIRYSRNGPIVDELLPPAARETGPVSLKWLGAHAGGWLTAMLAMDRASDASQFKEALRPWHVPTFAMLFADVEGHIGFKASGRIPLRRRAERGYRNGWEPDDQWAGLIPFEEMPELADPEQGWIITANNRVAADDFPQPLAGTWARGHRAVRIRQMIEERLQGTEGEPGKLALDDFRDMQQDVTSLRAIECLPALLDTLAGSADPRVQEAAAILKEWDGQVETEVVGPTLFNVFFTHWTEIVAAERFDEEALPLMVQGAEAIASRLLVDDPHGWFLDGGRESRILAAFNQTLNLLSKRFGPDMRQWTWGRLHLLQLRHVLSSRGDLSELLDRCGFGVKGDVGTVCNSGCDPDWQGSTGGGYRFMADLGQPLQSLCAIDGQSQSGNPGSRHYDDQLEDWIAGKYHEIPLAPGQLTKMSCEKFVLEPV